MYGIMAKSVILLSKLNLGFKYTIFKKWNEILLCRKTVKHKKTWTNTNAGKKASRCISFVVTREILLFFVLATSTLKCNSVSLSPWDCDYTLSCFVLLFFTAQDWVLPVLCLDCVLSKLSLNAKQNISIDVMAFFTNLYRSSSL